MRRLERERSFAERSRSDLYALVVERVVEPEIVGSWPLDQALFHRRAIEAEVARDLPEARLQFRAWLNLDFLFRPMSSDPARAGVRTALLGSLWMIGITIAVAFPIGVASAIYLEEYAGHGWLSRLIQTNISNLAGVPSIIYGMLGLAIFVRALGPLTSGAVFGLTDTNGRTILSAALTMALLILPLIIINAQEAIRAVPASLRQAAYGLGATRWQTIWSHVLPYALPGILTGSILAISRAIGETAPLVVVGASTYIVTDPSGPFSKFTALPIQIYNWTSRPEDTFRDIAAGAILVLLATLLSLNAAAVLLRNRFSGRMR
jgi:phosphate transport system permease protein